MSTAAPLPPGPQLPRWVQTVGFMLGGVRFLEACRRRYGDVITMGTLFDERFVMVFDPAQVKELFQGSGDQLHAGEANALLGPIVGERSVLLLDGAEHLRHRRLLLPPFHGRRMLAHVETMRACADAEIDRWPVGAPFTLLESMQALTLRVILRAVFGYAPGAEEDEFARRLRAMVEPLSRPRGVLVLNAVMRGRNERRPRRSSPPAGAPWTRSSTPRSPAAAPPPTSTSATTCSPACCRPRRGRRRPHRSRGPRRAPHPPARRARDDRHRPGLDVGPRAARRARARARAARATSATSTRSSRRRCASGR